MSDPIFFATPSEFRAWLAEHHNKATELLVGFHKKGSGKPSITWPEAVDQALCFGWIDGVRRSYDETSYTIRFTPRKPRSTWSAVNIKRANELTTLGLMHPAGLRAFEARAEERSAIYAYERMNARFPEEYERQFRTNQVAWDFFQAQAPSYQKTATWWVISAKKEETRRKRLAALIADSEHHRTIQPLTRPTKSQSS
jgi:uncharacterized protein YdeI (YjbR/CyaY-like superfamily)